MEIRDKISKQISVGFSIDELHANLLPMATPARKLKEKSGRFQKRLRRARPVSARGG
jgi:hypothetical protein